MGWQALIQRGTEVETPHGRGTVRAFSDMTQTAHVNVDGQLFEVPKEQLKQVEGAPDEVARPVTKNSVKVGDRVQKQANPRSTGEVVEVTQRTVKVQWDANGRVGAFQKRAVSQHLDYEVKDAPKIEFEQKFEGRWDEDKKRQQDLKDEWDREGEEEEKEDKTEEKTKEQQAQDTADDLYGLMRLKERLEDKIDTEVDGELKELREQVKRNQKLEVKVGDKVNIIEGIKHKQLERLITYSALKLNSLLVGMAGTGKTHAASQVAEALGLEFSSISVGAQTSKSDIVGFVNATGGIVETEFGKRYEHGGVFLMDEIDAGNANVLIQINSALSNGYMAFPKGMVKKHEDFIFIASANTYGNGANRQYVGRNQLDAATLDRFAVIDWEIDDELEENMAVGLNGKAWYMAVRAARDYVNEKNIRALITPRATQKGSQLLDVGQQVDEAIDATMLASVPQDKRPDVKEVATKIFEKFASEVPGKVEASVGELLRQDS